VSGRPGARAAPGGRKRDLAGLADAERWQQRSRRPPRAGPRVVAGTEGAELALPAGRARR
jgi:hypothetical protein